MVNLLSPRSDWIKTLCVQFWDGLDFPSFSQFVSFKCQFDRRRDNDTWSRKARTDVGARASSYIPAAAAGCWWLEARDPRNQNWSCLLPLLHFCLPFTQPVTKLHLALNWTDLLLVIELQVLLQDLLLHWKTLHLGYKAFQMQLCTKCIWKVQGWEKFWALW